jgi:hypothetical protein
LLNKSSTKSPIDRPKSALDPNSPLSSVKNKGINTGVKLPPIKNKKKKSKKS